MSEYIKITVGEKEYMLGYPNRKSIVRCEEKTGLELGKIESKLISSFDKVFYGALLEKQPEMTFDKAEEIIDKLIEEDVYDYNEISEKLLSMIMVKAGLNSKAKKHQALTLIKE